MGRTTGARGPSVDKKGLHSERCPATRFSFDGKRNPLVHPPARGPICLFGRRDRGVVEAQNQWREDLASQFMSITIHPELEVRLRARAEAEGLSVEAYVERIARDDERAEQELEALALEGLNSGDSIVADERYWEDKRRRLMERHEKTGTG